MKEQFTVTIVLILWISQTVNERFLNRSFILNKQIFLYKIMNKLFIEEKTNKLGGKKTTIPKTNELNFFLNN